MRAILVLAAAWLLVAQAAAPAPFSAEAEILRTNLVQASDSGQCDGERGHKHDHRRDCQTCCLACPAAAGLPLVSARSDAELPSPVRDLTRIANMPSERTGGPPLGWGGSWCSRAPPFFS
ncbi:hypothetical protein [Methylosinus sporium]|uniref:hypothetical protein n=1 Tax=Methylosinus sporium TaxID=428 RepID=UPI003839E53F